MKNAVKILGLLLILGLTSCKSGFETYKPNTQPSFGEVETEEEYEDELAYQAEYSEEQGAQASDSPAAGSRTYSNDPELDKGEEIEVDEKETVDETEEVSKKKETPCEDVLYLHDGRSFPITFLSETDASIKFKKCDDPINRTWRKEKSKINKIVFSDGTEQDMGSTPVTNDGANPVAVAAGVGIGAMAVGAGVVAIICAVILAPILFLLLLFS